MGITKIFFNFLLNLDEGNNGRHYLYIEGKFINKHRTYHIALDFTLQKTKTLYSGLLAHCNS